MRPRVVVAAAVVALLGVIAWRVAGASPRAAAPPADVTTATAPVTRGDAVERVRVAGVLSYDGGFEVVNLLPSGVLTAVPRPGTVIGRGQELFRISGTSVVLLHGSSPAWRAFTAGMRDGPDVRQLEENLVALGLDPSRRITVDSHFTAATADAIERWQAQRRLDLGQVVFLPGPVRVTGGPPRVGGLVGPGDAVLSATSPTLVVVARVTTDRQHLVHTGDEVLVSLPTSGAPVPGTVTAIGHLSPMPEGGPPTLPITVAVTLPADAAGLDQAPVQVAITVARHRSVLLVPVTALLAKAGGGYQVRVVEAAGFRLVDVRPGIYDDTAGAVEITGVGLEDGMLVEVPAP